MLGGRVNEKHQNGRSCSNGKIGDGAHQETVEYSSHLEGSLSGTRESSESAISYA